MEIVELNERASETIIKLANLWRKSVAATHAFLSEREIYEIEPEVITGLKSVEKLVAARDERGEFCAFMGIEKHRLEMLFVKPAMTGKGIGRALVEFGIKEYQINKTTVNEQNPNAVKFYTRLGFKPYKRTPTDEQSRPYPLIYMCIPESDRT